MIRKAGILMVASVLGLMLSLNMYVDAKAADPSTDEISVNVDLLSDKLDDQFPIGLFWIPGADQLTDQHMQDIVDINANFLVPMNGTNTFAANDRVLALAAEYGLKVFVADDVITQAEGKFINNREPLSDEYLDFVKEFAEYYRGKPGVFGYEVRDEPTGYEAMDKVGQVQELIRQYAPGYPVFVNLTGYWDNFNHTGYTREHTGEYVTPEQTLGQTFRTAKDEVEIAQIQVWLDFRQFTDDETLTMNIWESPAKTHLVASRTLTSDHSRLFTTFDFDSVTVEPDTEYYWELVHEGGGDRSVGWVVRTLDGEDWYPDGNAYIGGRSVDADFFFFVNSSFYENYVTQWASQHPDMLSFDHYPFVVSAGIDENYFTTLEIVRRQALKHDLNLWSYMQTVKFNDEMRVPTEGDMRFNLYTNLAYGVKGIIYFTYYTPRIPGFQDAIFDLNDRKTAKYDFAQQNNAELLVIGDTLKQLTSLAVYHTGDTIPKNTVRLPAESVVQPTDPSEPYIISYFEHQDGSPYVMIVNRDENNAREGVFTIKGHPAWVREVLKGDGQLGQATYDATSGTMTLSFRPGDGILLELPSNSGDAIVGAGTAPLEGPATLALVEEVFDEIPSNVSLKILSLNIGVGGSLTSPIDVAKAIEYTQADVVGVQEPFDSLFIIADELGFHVNERLAVLSRFPIIDNGQRDYVYIEVDPGYVVAVSNVHLPAGPYFPYQLRDQNLTVAQAVAHDEAYRGRLMAGRFQSLPILVQRGVPVFLTGDFNTPSHLDWTDDAKHLHFDLAVPWPVSKKLEALGFVDSYREMHADPVATPGFTWTPGEPKGGSIADDEKHDRIDFVYASGPASVVSSHVVGEAGVHSDIVYEPWVTDHRGVLSEFQVDPAPRGVIEQDPVPIQATLTPDKAVYAPGDIVTLAYTEANRVFDRIVITSDDPTVDTTNLWKYAATNSSTIVGDLVPEGQVTFSGTAQWREGTYTAALLANSGPFVLAKTSFKIEGPSGEGDVELVEQDLSPRIAVDKHDFAKGEVITVHYFNASSPLDWIGLFFQGAEPAAGSIIWKYASTDSEQASSLKQNGQITLQTTHAVLVPGVYTLHFLADDGYQSMDTIDIEITP